MADSVSLRVIAHMQSDFDAKFGIPRQSGLVPTALSAVVFEPEYRNPDALRGLEGFSHLWLVWQFSQCVREEWSPTVRPPRLGGNTRVGVFATRSPFRPNAIGLSSVELDRVETDPALGPVIWVRGADLMNGTPIFDIKPYLPYTDSHPEARGGFAMAPEDGRVEVLCPPDLLQKLPPDKRQALVDVLSQDPRPGYRHGDAGPYGLSFAGLNVRFTVDGGVLTVREIAKS